MVTIAEPTANSCLCSLETDNGKVSKWVNCVTVSLTQLYKNGLNSRDHDYFFLVPLRSKTIEDLMIWIIHVSEKGN